MKRTRASPARAPARQDAVTTIHVARADAVAGRQSGCSSMLRSLSAGSPALEEELRELVDPLPGGTTCAYHRGTKSCGQPPTSSTVAVNPLRGSAIVVARNEQQSVGSRPEGQSGRAVERAPLAHARTRRTLLDSGAISPTESDLMDRSRCSPG